MMRNAKHSMRAVKLRRCGIGKRQDWQVKKREKQHDYTFSRTSTRNKQLTSTSAASLRKRNELSKQSPAREATVNGQSTTTYFKRSS